MKARKRRQGAELEHGAGHGSAGGSKSENSENEGDRENEGGQQPHWTAHQVADDVDTQAIGRITDRGRDEGKRKGDHNRLQDAPGRRTCPAPVPPDEDGHQRSEEGYPQAGQAPERVGHLVVGPDEQQILRAIDGAHIHRFREEHLQQRRADGVGVDEGHQ